MAHGQDDPTNARIDGLFVQGHHDVPRRGDEAPTLVEILESLLAMVYPDGWVRSVIKPFKPATALDIARRVDFHVNYDRHPAAQALAPHATVLLERRDVVFYTTHLYSKVTEVTADGQVYGTGLSGAAVSAPEQRELYVAIHWPGFWSSSSPHVD
ncbi:MAG: hypothetical protein U0271_11520 [Polyangiaceae bacterium]